MLLDLFGWLGVVNELRSLAGLGAEDGDDLDGVEGAERVKEPPLLRPPLLFA